MMRYIPLLLLLGLGPSLLAQNVLPLGKWRSHLPYREGRFVTQSASTIYYSTGWSLLLLDKEELSTERLSKVEGLSNVGIRRLEFNTNSETLIVVYDNSVIDLVKESAEERTIVTLNQIANFSNFVGEKVIYDIDVDDTGNSIYLAANYGVSQVNLERNEFVFTTFTGIDVLDVQVYEGNIYAATEEGIYRAPIDNVNLDDFGNWTLLGADQGFPEVYSANSLDVFSGILYLGIDDVLYKYENNALSFFYDRPGSTLKFLKATGQHIYAYYPICTPEGCSGGSLMYFDVNGAIAEVPRSCFSSLDAVAEDQQGRIWLGDESRDFRYLESSAATECVQLTFDSPFSIENREMTIADNTLWLAAGGVDQRFSARFIDHGFAAFKDGSWSIYNRRNREELKGENPSDNFRDDDLFDFITMAVHPGNGKVYAGSFTEGIIEFDPATDEMTLYNENNSTLETAEGDIARSRISGLVFDEDNNLWVSNHTARNNQPLSVLTNEGFWQSFAFSGPCLDTDVQQIDVDLNGFKWIVLGSDQSGVMVYDEGELSDPSDDRCRIFSAVNSNLPTNSSNCLAVDLDGDVWVGTTEGVVIFECGASAFDAACQGSRRIVEQDGFNAFLLETEDVQAIAVDGANRKWIGTRNGLFLLSPSGEEQILRFDESNSPLFDDNIIDIAVNDETGEVFIGTDKGILSYQGDATEGGRVNSAMVEVFPNPVRPEYDGPISIRGLARDANVKITDVNGKLVFETTANGGQAVWNGLDYNGRRANSGVYLIFATTNSRNSGFSDPDATVGKILLLN